MKHSNIAIFVPHLGCPNDCSFCNQRSITGKVSEPTPDDVYLACEEAFRNKSLVSKNCEIAFFGGSFSAINQELMCSLLKAGFDCVQRYGFKGLRCSTRPDAIDENVLKLFKKYGMTSIELGVQSLDDAVLSANKRGHTKNDVYKAVSLIKEFGFELTLQMMVGLYSDSYDKIIDTAEQIIKLVPKSVRIYPTIVIKNTLLEQLFLSGEYKPIELEQAVEICSELLLKFEKANIDVIRLSLHSSDMLQSEIVAGPYHPSFRELCENKIFLDRIKDRISQYSDRQKKFTLTVDPCFASKVLGHKKKNILELQNLGFNINVVVQKLNGKEFVIERGE